MAPAFDAKQPAREHVWDTLEKEGVARFPFPPHGRIPNFAGAQAAADCLLDHPTVAGAEHAKVNPDAPQRFVRQALLAAGVEVHVPTPRLKGGFHRLDPTQLDPDEVPEAAKLSKMEAYAEPVELDELPTMDVIVAGSVAVTAHGHRAGKGEGYSDLEYAILRELGHPETPVVTTVHPLQIVDELPREPTDVPLSVIATPKRTIDVADPPSAPEGIEWGKLAEERIEAMTVLAELRERR